jgi:hypothetical protein
MKIKLSKKEIKSGNSRIDWAEGLILQLPETHEGRNSWLINYGRKDESKKQREKWELDNKRKLKYNKKTQCWN